MMTRRQQERRSFFRRAAAGMLAAVAAAYVPNLVFATPLSAEQYAATGIAGIVQTRREAAMQDMARQFEEQCWGESGRKRLGEALAEYKVPRQPHAIGYWTTSGDFVGDDLAAIRKARAKAAGRGGLHP